MRELKNQTKVNEDTNSEDDKISSFSKRLNSLKSKLKLGPHYKMERFSVVLGGTLTSLIVISVLSLVSHQTSVANNASAQAIYTENFNFSLSREKLYVEGVFGNEDQTDVMILLRMQNANSMSADAKNYELFITGEKKSLSYEPEVSFSLFGSSGYGIIRFQHDDPIPREIVDITIRSNSNLSAQKDSGSTGDETDGSFSQYDQAKFYVNPGAESVQTLDWLDVDETEPTRLYTALVAESLDSEIRDEIKEQTEELSQLLNRAQEYTNRLVSAGYEPPETPWFVKGDYIDDRGVFVAAENLPGTFELDYTTKTVRDGYVNQVMNDFSSYDEFMNQLSEDRSVNRGDGAKEEQVNRVDELLGDDGTVLELNTIQTGSSPSAQIAAKDSVESLQSTWRSFLNVKSKLQRDSMRKLLVLDADVQSQRSSYSVQEDKNAVHFY